MRNQKGFSLVELLIVVAIIGIIAAIAVPSLLSARMSANESSAIGNLRTLASAEATVLSLSGGYQDMATLVGNSHLDSSWASPVTKNSYILTESNVTASTFSFNADPELAGSSGNRGFFVDQSYVIRANATGSASLADNPIGTASGS